jgi:hypothetical protein
MSGPGNDKARNEQDAEQVRQRRSGIVQRLNVRPWEQSLSRQTQGGRVEGTIRLEDRAGSPPRRRSQAWRSSIFAPWTSLRPCLGRARL